MSSRGKSALLLVGILTAGCLLRAVPLDWQSVWFDEAQWARQMVETPSLAAWLQRSDDANHDMVPLYFILQYGWCHYVVGSVIGMRWLSVFFGLCTILCTWRMAHEWYGPRVGLMAAACCSLSPYQVYFSQELRPYVLVALLGVTAIYTLHRALYRGGRRWWVANIVVNSLLMWTHLFGLWLIVTQGLFLLLFHARPWRRSIGWGVANALLMIPVLLLVLTWTNPGYPPLGAHWLEMASTWLFVDGFHLALLVYYRTLSVPSELFAHFPAGMTYAFPFLMAGFSVAFVAGVLLQIARIWRENPREPSEGHERTAPFTRQTTVLLLMCFALPGLWLVLFTVLVVPAFQLRYLIYSAPALYILASSGILGLRKAWLRRGIAGLLLGSLGAASLIEMALPTRPDHRGAARYVQSGIAPGEKVLWQPAFTHTTFAFNLDPELPRIEAGACTRLPHEIAEIERALERGEGIWALHGIWDISSARARAEAVERYLDSRRIAYTRRLFLGRWDIVVYHCRPSPELRPLDDPQELARLEGLTTSEAQDAALRWNLLLGYERAGRFAEAARLCRKQLDAVPLTPEGRAAFEESLRCSGWNDDLGEGGSHTDGYVAEWFTAWARTHLALGAPAGTLEEIQAYAERFRDNPALPEIIEGLKARLAAE